MPTPDWLDLAKQGDLTPDALANEAAELRLDAICGDITQLLYRAHELATRIDPELGEYFVDTMVRALGGKP